MMNPEFLQTPQVAIIYAPYVEKDTFIWMNPGVGRLLTPNIYKHYFFFEKDFDKAVQRSCDFALNLIYKRINSIGTL